MSDDWNKYKDDPRVEKAEGVWKGLPTVAKFAVVVVVLMVVAAVFGG